ncbi:hypothetical protein FRB99_007651 [Tulasnella sp. 403]|nr:hypothetical protein FRB99_007651 [Tulasnella sp. 403]
MEACGTSFTLPLKMPIMDAQKRDYLIGIGLLLVVVVEWTGSSFVTQGLFDSGYEKPFLVTYLNTSAFAIYLLPFLIRKWLKQRSEAAEDVRTFGQYSALSTDMPTRVSATYRSRSLSIVASPRIVPTNPAELPPLTTEETAKLASIFCFFWFIANWAVNASLDYTSVANSTILASMSGFFTMGIGRAFGIEAITLGKAGAVIASFLGVLLVSLEDSSSDSSTTGASPSKLFSRSVSPTVSTSNTPANSNPLLGDFLALLSALFYALYVTLLKLRIKEESRINMQLFFGFVGLFNVVALWPVAVLLHVTGVETFELPKSSDVWWVLIINMFITLSSDYLYLISMLKTTPLLVTVGLALTIPLAVIGDFVFFRTIASPQVILGAALVVLSFIALGAEGKTEEVPSPEAVGYEAVDYDTVENDIGHDPIDQDRSGRRGTRYAVRSSPEEDAIPVFTSCYWCRGKAKALLNSYLHAGAGTVLTSSSSRLYPFTKADPFRHPRPSAMRTTPESKGDSQKRSFDCTPKPSNALKSFHEMQRERRRKERSRTDPPPWITRKLAVFIVIGLIVFATYVYIGRACVPFIRRDPGADGWSRGVGVAFLCVYCVLWVITVWSYAKAVLTPPGFARDYVQKKPALIGRPYTQTRGSDADSTNSIGPDPHDDGDDDDGPQRDEFGLHRSMSRSSLGSQDPTQTIAPTNPLAIVPEDRSHIPAPKWSSSETTKRSSGGDHQFDDDATELDAFPPSAAIRAKGKTSKESESTTAHDARPVKPPAAHTRFAQRSAHPPSSIPNDLPPPKHSRNPPRHPVLSEEFRYCHHEGIVKPPRTHHCRTLNAKDNRTGLFAIFTGALLGTHIRLLLLNLSTVEEYGIKAMQETESHLLRTMFPWWNWKAMHRTRKTWDKEWGELTTEGNIWWLGSARKNWEQVMGKNPIGWFLPIGDSPADGLEYPINPRFTANGIWRRRKDWDPELQ